MGNSVFIFHDLMNTLLSRAEVKHKNNTDLSNRMDFKVIEYS